MLSIILLSVAATFAWCGCSNGAPATPADPVSTLPDVDLDAQWEAVVPPAETGPDAERPACIHPEVTADCQDGWCRIPAGCFVMGSPPGEYFRGRYTETRVQVTLSHAFLIQQHEMTQEEWTALGFDNPSTAKPYLVDCDQPDCPVGNVNYFEAADFANAMSDAHGLPNCYAFEGCRIDPNWGMVCDHVRSVAPTVYECDGFRLPTQAEWEYAARAGTSTAYYSGDITKYDNATGNVCRVETNLEPIAWYCANAGDPSTTHPVMQKRPNAWGLYDVLGNAGEWANDEFKGLGYGTDPLTDPGGVPVGNGQGVLRGGAANSWPTICRVAFHYEVSTDSRDPGVGFRLVRTLRDNR